jgi:hypothetical protein
MRYSLGKAIDDEKLGGGHSSMSGGRRRRDLRWRLEHGVLSYKNRIKRTVRTRRFFERTELNSWWVEL